MADTSNDNGAISTHDPTVARDDIGGEVTGDAPTVASSRNASETSTDPGTSPHRVDPWDATISSDSSHVPPTTGAHDSTSTSGVSVQGARSIGRFAILRELGRGGMGQVYLAYDETLDRRVAIKLLTATTGGQQADQRLVREAQAMAKLAHPNVATVYDVGTFRGRIFVAMEYIAGQTLTDWQSETQRSWQEILAMYIQAGRGLSAAHQSNIVHRDFKPANVLVGDARARVLDFGLARLSSPEEPPDSPPSSSGDTTGDTPGDGTISHGNPAWSQKLTAYGALMGTPLYMSPEQYRAQPADARSDQYSFCIALYEALFGSSPFATSSFEAHKRAKYRDQVQKPEQLPIELSAVYPLLARGLSADPDERWPDIDQLLDRLEQHLTTNASNQFSRTHSRAFLAITTPMAVMVLVALYRLRDPDTKPNAELAWLIGAGFFVLLSLVVLYVKRYIKDSKLALRTAIFLPATLGLVEFNRTMALLQDLPVDQIFVHDLTILTTCCAIAGFTLHRMFGAAAFAMAILATVAALYPSYARHCAVAGTMVFPIVALAETWRLTRMELGKPTLRDWVTRSMAGNERP